MRDVIAGVIAAGLLLVAASLATTLRLYRRRRERARDAQRALGRTVIAEIPAGDDLVLFAEDETRFYHGDRSIDKHVIAAARVLINGSPIAASVSRGAPSGAAVQSVSVDDRPEGIARDRWDVAIDILTDPRVDENRPRFAPSHPSQGETGLERAPRAVEHAAAETILIECGAIRERVSQELARAVFDAVKRDIEQRNRQI